MQRIPKIIITLFSFLLLTSCSSVVEKDWNALIPENSSFVILPEDGLNVQEIIAKEYASYLDDLSPSSIQLIAGLDVEVNEPLGLKALVLNPINSVQSSYLWIANAPDENLKSWAPRFYQPFTQNKYQFNGFIIHKLFFNKSNIFAAQVNDYLLLSESSLLIENSLRAYLGLLNPMQLDGTPPASSLVMNTPQLNQWIEQFAAVSYRPALLSKFSGTKPVALNFKEPTDSTDNIELTGQIPLTEAAHSLLIDGMSYENKEIVLDKHIATNAAAFALLRLPPVAIPAKPKSGLTTALDSLLLQDMDIYRNLATTLDTEFAFEAFPESGLMSVGEFLFMRKLKSRRDFQRRLNNLVEKGLAFRQDNTYQISSSIMAKLIGSELSTLRDFYLAFSNDVVVIAKRKGLAESVNADRIRRRVIYYDESYSSIREDMTNEVSGFVWSDTQAFLQFIAPYLKADHSAGGILSRFDLITMNMTRNEGAVDFSLKTHTKEGSALPYEELWVQPLSNVDLSGKPVLGDLIGSSSDEIIISTEDGRVLALAQDGTLVMETSTDGLEPVGGPLLYDWYGNGEQIVFLAAGTKIFAWNESGDLLPRFPIDMGNLISAPILVQDVLRNGVPEIVVATEDRKVHILDGRGDNIRGWPKNTNAIVKSQPVFEIMEDIWSIWAYSENTLHSWLRNGNARPGYPQFVNARFTGSPLIFDDQVLGGAADGHLYSIGVNPLFNDSTAASVTSDSVGVRSLYVVNSELNSISLENNVLLRDSSNFYREDLLVTQSSNGSVFMYNKSGKLRFTQSLGQPTSSTFAPQLIDINADRDQELLALAEFGRLFAWEVLSEQRIFGIPTSGMKYPIIVDLNGDRQMELIAKTREGLRCWTINPSP